MDILRKEQRWSIQQSSRNSKPLSRTTQKRRSRPFDQIMVENSHQMNSKSYAKTQGLRGIYPLHIIHNIMGLQKGIIEWSWIYKGHASWSRSSHASMGRIFQNNSVCIEPYSTQSNWEQDTWKIIFWQETKSQSSQNIWLSSVHTHSKRKEDKVRSFRK